MKTDKSVFVGVVTSNVRHDDVIMTTRGLVLPHNIMVMRKSVIRNSWFKIKTAKKGIRNENERSKTFLKLLFVGNANF